MCILKLSYLTAVVPVAILLTASFFVLFTLRKIEEKGLRAFGYVVVGFLWLAALVVFSGAVYKIAQGSAEMKSMMQEKMRMGHLMKMPVQYNPPAMPPTLSKGALTKDQKLPGCSKCQANKGVVSKTE